MFTVDKIKDITAQDTANYAGDDISWDADNFVCMTDGNLVSDCDEIKEGTICLRIEIGVVPAAISSLTIRVRLAAIMSAGTNKVLPYNGAVSVDPTNENEQDYSTAGIWVEHNCDAMIADMVDLGGYCALRFGSDTGAKSKISEIEIDMVYDTYKVEGYTRDSSKAIKANCPCSIAQNEGGSPPVYTYKGNGSSNGAGFYSFGGLDPGDYRVYAKLADSPDIWGCTNNDITAILET